MKNNSFNCDKCGLCCQNVGRLDLYSDLDRGDGVCRHYDEKTKLCTIYTTRPLKCNVDAMYNAFFYQTMSRNAFYKLNYEACKELKAGKI